MTNDKSWRGYQYFISKDYLKTEADKWNNLRERARKEISVFAQLKLEWIIFYHLQAEKNATLTAAHFGITRKTFHKWFCRFKENDLCGLEENSRAPHHVRKRQISWEQRLKVRSLRKSHLKYGKMKLTGLYFDLHQEKISSWKIQKVIEEDDLYPDKPKASRLRNKHIQARIHQRQRITKLIKKTKSTFYGILIL